MRAGVIQIKAGLPVAAYPDAPDALCRVRGYTAGSIVLSYRAVHYQWQCSRRHFRHLAATFSVPLPANMNMILSGPFILR